MSDKAEFIAHIQQHSGMIERVVRLYTDRPEDRQDLRQEILAQAWRSFATFRAEARFSTWLYRLAVNVAISTLRRRRVRETAPPVSPSEPAESPVDQLAEAELRRRILSLLNPVEKSIVLGLIEGYEPAEIAAALGITPGNARVKIHRLRQKLREYGIGTLA